MFGRKSLRDQNQTIVAEIQNGHRRKPVHQVPAVLRNGRVDPVEQFAFEQFAWFGATLDQHTNERWSFEETNQTMLRSGEGGEYGRRWNIYFNSLHLGWIEVSPDPGTFAVLGNRVEDYAASPKAAMEMELSFMQFIPADEAFNILYWPSLVMQPSSDGYEAARQRASIAANAARTGYLWDVMQAGGEYVPDLSFRAEGPYSIYRNTVEHWKKTGFNPFMDL